MKNNSADAKGKGFPLWITAAEVRVDDSSEPITDSQIAFVKGVLPTLEWAALVKVRTMLCCCHFLLHSTVFRHMCLSD
jgi:hypothetical protein